MTRSGVRVNRLLGHLRTRPAAAESKSSESEPWQWDGGKLPDGWKSFVMQTGMGVDVHGSDPTKAAKRAVDEAIRHNSLTGIGRMILAKDDNGKKKLDWSRMKIILTIACPLHEQLDREAVSATLPHGEVHIRVEDGGMLVDTGGGNDQMLIALAAVLVCYTEE